MSTGTGWTVHSEPLLPLPPLGDLLQCVDDHALDTPAQIFVEDAAGSLTWAQLSHQSHLVSSALDQLGVQRGHRVAVRLGSACHFSVCLFGAWRLGAIVVPVSPELPDHLSTALISDAGCRVSIGDDNHREPTPSYVPFADLLRSRGAETLAETRPEPAGNDPLLILYTSGTTGAARGVCCTHDQVHFCLAAIQSVLHYTRADTIFCRLPLTFDYGLYQLLLAAAIGARVVFAPPSWDPTLTLHLERTSATIIPLTPGIAALIVSAARRHSTGLGRVRLFTNTGERLSPARQRALADLMPEATFATMYGLTECKRVSVGLLDTSRLPVDHVGRPLPGTSVTILDGAERSVPDETCGQIVVIGDNVARYWGGGGSTGVRFGLTQDGRRVLYTGDRGYFGSDGNLRVVGRDDSLIKVRGVRVSTNEIEAAAESIEGVQEARVSGTGEEVVLLLVTTRPLSEIRQELSAQLGAFRVPTNCQAVVSLPRTANTKFKH